MLALSGDQLVPDDDVNPWKEQGGSVKGHLVLELCGHQPSRGALTDVDGCYDTRRVTRDLQRESSRG